MHLAHYGDAGSHGRDPFLPRPSVVPLHTCQIRRHAFLHLWSCNHCVLVGTTAYKRHNLIGHNYIGHNYIDRTFLERNCIGHTHVGHDYIRHYYIGHEYIGHNYVGHVFTGHNDTAFSGHSGHSQVLNGSPYSLPGTRRDASSSTKCP